MNAKQCFSIERCPSIFLIYTSYSLLSLTLPYSHLLLPPPSLSSCLTLTVIRSWHLLPAYFPHVFLPCPTQDTPYILLLSFHLCPSPFSVLRLHAVSLSRLIPCGVPDRAAHSSWIFLRCWLGIDCGTFSVGAHHCIFVSQHGIPLCL